MSFCICNLYCFKMKKYILLFLLFSNLCFAESNFGVINYIKTDKKIVALTFDADMSPFMLKALKSGKVKSWYDSQLINYLTQEKIPATLFLTGMWIENYAAETATLSANPLFEIGNHSYSHPAFSSPCYHLPNVKESGDALQVQKTDTLLQKYVPNYRKYFRFPGLCYDKDDVDIVSKSDYQIIGGDVFAGDGFQRNRNSIVRNVMREVQPGSIVILHMIGGPNAPETKSAVPIIVEKLKKQGYQFVKVSELLTASTTSTNSDNYFLNMIRKFFKIKPYA